MTNEIIVSEFTTEELEKQSAAAIEKGYKLFGEMYASEIFPFNQKFKKEN